MAELGTDGWLRELLPEGVTLDQLFAIHDNMKREKRKYRILELNPQGKCELVHEPFELILGESINMVASSCVYAPMKDRRSAEYYRELCVLAFVLKAASDAKTKPTVESE